VSGDEVEVAETGQRSVRELAAVSDRYRWAVLMIVGGGRRCAFPPYACWVAGNIQAAYVMSTRPDHQKQPAPT